MDLFYIVFFTESDVGCGYIAEHYYIKTGAHELRTLRNIVSGIPLAETNSALRSVVEATDKQRIVVNATDNPPTLSNLLLNAAYGGHRLREIAYVINNRLGKPVESGLYLLGELSKKENKPL